MATIKRTLTNKALAEKCKALENGLSNKDVATNMVSSETLFQHGLKPNTH